MLNETINAGINDPNCAFFVGNFLGSYMTIKWVFTLVVLYFAIRIMDKAIIEPLLEWMKIKLYKKKRK